MISQADQIKNELGILGIGAYIPQLRLKREEIVAANAWLNPGLVSLARSERSVTSYDEDVVTMAVDAARACLCQIDRQRVTDVYLGSTTSPFADRLNAGIVAGALGLSETIRAQDISGSMRAGTSALLSAIDAAVARQSTALCIASDRRAAAAGTVQELMTGHGAAAILIGSGGSIARILGSASLTVDFVDHFRETGSEFDYHWEDRWVREEGYFKLIPRLVAEALKDAQIEPHEVTHFCLPMLPARVDKTVAKKCGLVESSMRDNLFEGCGDAGAAHPLLMLVQALESAQPGHKILVVGFGQGGDALVLEATDAIAATRHKRSGLNRSLGRRSTISYPRYLALHGLLKIDRGMRAESDKPTAQTAAYRHRDFLLGLVGGRCTVCGTRQIPRSSICVNPDCLASDSQVPDSFADSTGTVASWSQDNLVYTPDPPAYYGMIDFDHGGRLMMDFTNIWGQKIGVGLPVRMVFRVKDRDSKRGFTRYFWKAAPMDPEEV